MDRMKEPMLDGTSYNIRPDGKISFSSTTLRRRRGPAFNLGFIVEIAKQEHPDIPFDELDLRIENVDDSESPHHILLQKK